VHEGAREHAGDGQREVHCHSYKWAGAVLRTYLRAFRGVHQHYLHLDVATYETMINAKWVTPALIQRRCIGGLFVHTGYTSAKAFLLCPMKLEMRIADILPVAI
jgi:hypothetical protein